MQDLHINWFPGHMKKAIDEITQKIALFDLVIQVIDARAPFSTTNPLVQKLIKTHRAKSLFIINKIDLADPVVTDEWKAFFDQNHIPYLLINSKIRFSQKKFWHITNQILATEIIRKKHLGIVNPIWKMMIIGVPNVGKSTFINNVLTHKKAGVGNIPGFTKGQQWYKVRSNWLMMDTPGILWPKIANNAAQVNLSIVQAINQKVLPIQELVLILINKLLLLYPDAMQMLFQYNWPRTTLIHDEIIKMGQALWPSNSSEEVYNKIFNVIANQTKFRCSWERPADIELYE